LFYSYRGKGLAKGSARVFQVKGRVEEDTVGSTGAQIMVARCSKHEDGRISWRELFMIGKVTRIDLRGVTCSRVVIPEKHPLDHVKTSALKKLCEDSVQILLFSMHTIEFLGIIESKIGDLKSLGGGFFLRNLRSLIMKRVEKTVVEKLIRYVRMESLEGLEIENVDPESLAFLEGTRFSKLKRIRLISTGIKRIEGLNGGSLPVLRMLSLQGSSELRLDEDMCKELLQQVEYLTMELEAYMAYMKGMDISEDGHEYLRVPHERRWKEIEVRITTNQAEMSKKYGQIVTEMLGGYTGLKRLVLSFTLK
jgi:hypothetical protein